MDQEQRSQVASKVTSAREARGLSQKELAKRAGLAPNTIGAIEAGKRVQPGSLGKVLAELSIEPPAEVSERAEWPPDVHLVSEVIGMWLLGMSEDDRPAAVLALMQHLTQGGTKSGD